MKVDHIRLVVQPRPEDDHVTASETLDGRQWQITWYASRLEDAWFFNITSDVGETIYGVPVGVGVLPLYKHAAGGDVPPGALFFQTTHGRDPRVDDFAKGKAIACYIEAELHAELEGSA